jgi:FixJ family two-component response regulator
MHSAALPHRTRRSHQTPLEQNSSGSGVRGNLPVCWAPNERARKMAGSLVSVVDDDESVRESLPGLVKAFGFPVCAFSSAEEFLESGRLSQTKCLILDIAMPGMSGPELQSELKRRQLEVPVIFITAQRDETVRTRMLEGGAVECLFKPFSATALLKALKAAFRV